MSLRYGQKLSPPDELWVSQSKYPAEARAAFHFAKAINTSDTEWLSGLVVPTTRYCSQRILHDLTGDEIPTLIDGLTESVRRTNRSLAVDLGVSADEHPCALIYMSASPTDQCWLRAPYNIAAFNMTETGSLAGINVTIPSLGPSCKPEVIFPGRRRPPTPARAVATNQANIKLVPLLLNGTHPLDTGMRLCVADVRKSFPTAAVEVVVAKPGDERASAICGSIGMTGFPSLVVYVDDEITFYYQGIVFPEVVCRDLSSYLDTAHGDLG